MHARTVGFYREGETSMLEQSLAGHGLLFGAMEITQDRPIGILASRLALKGWATTQRGWGSRTTLSLACLSLVSEPTGDVLRDKSTIPKTPRKSVDSAKCGIGQGHGRLPATGFAINCAKDILKPMSGA
jgi:hypothetical protein